MAIYSFMVFPCCLGVKIDYVECPDKSRCLDYETCCPTSDTEYGCCPLPHAVCCEDKTHCCPKGYRLSIAFWLGQLPINEFPGLQPMDLFLYVLFSHFRPRDVPKGIFLLFFHKLCIHMHVHKTTLKETVPSSNITCS